MTRPTNTGSDTRPAGPSWRGYFFAFGAAVAYAGSQVVAREGVADFGAPLVGTTIALAFATLGFVAIAARNLSAHTSDFRRGAAYFACAGIFSATGVAALFLAVERAEVIIVSPISSSYPLFTLLFAVVFLRDLERLTPRLFVGAAIVVVGIALISAA